MARTRQKDSFWLSYSDLMTSLFFIMLMLFVICVSKMKYDNNVLQTKFEEANATKEQLQTERDEANATKEQLERILTLDAQFEELTKSSALTYVEEKKMFVAKDFMGIEIFEPYSDIIKPEYEEMVDDVGQSLQELVKRLNKKNPNLSFQLVIEGYAAIEYDRLKSNNYNKDNRDSYDLSYRRALTLYFRWKSKGIDLRKYNTEVIIAGSGFNGINRDIQNEDNNKRFVIQIIPKISKPEGVDSIPYLNDTKISEPQKELSRLYKSR